MAALRALAQDRRDAGRSSPRLGVLLTDVLVGLVIAALVSVVILLYSASKPAIATLGRLPGRTTTSSMPIATPMPRPSRGC